MDTITGTLGGNAELTGGLVLKILDEVTPDDIPEPYIPSTAGIGELWQWQLPTVAMLGSDMTIDSLADRFSRVKGSLNDPFVYVIGGHSNRKEIDRLGYRDIAGGIAVGADHLSTMDYDQYLRIGGILAYVHGKATFSGENSATAQKARHDSYVAALYGAYESFNGEKLKTDISVIGGFSYGKNKLRWNEPDLSRSAKVNAVDIFAKGEFTGNVVSFSGCQCGPWLSAKYHHVRQDAYEEHDVDSGSVRTDPVTYHFIDTIVGLNLEK